MAKSRSKPAIARNAVELRVNEKVLFDTQLADPLVFKIGFRFEIRSAQACRHGFRSSQWAAGEVALSALSRPPNEALAGVSKIVVDKPAKVSS